MPEDFSLYMQYPVDEGPVKHIKIYTLHGANFFSADPVVCIRIQLGAFDEVYSNDIDGLHDRLVSALPSLFDHYCSPGVPGGFLMRVKEGTLLGHIIEHVSIELQTLAGMDVGYGKTRSTPEKGVYNVIFRFFDEIAGIYAGKAALNMINAFVQGQDFDVKTIVENLIEIREKRLLGPSTQAIVQEAEKRKIPHLRLDAYNLVQLGTGKYSKWVRATITSDTSFIAAETAANKYLCNLILGDAGLPVALAALCHTHTQLSNFRTKTSSPLVIRPASNQAGNILYVNLKEDNEIIEAFDDVLTVDDDVFVREYNEGFAYRLLVIDYKFVAAVKLTPPFISGNGTDSVAVLIDKLNRDPQRQTGDKGKLSLVEIDDVTLEILSNKGFTLLSVLPEGKVLYLKHSGNLRFGGSAMDVTDVVHPVNKFLAERAAKTIGLNVAGVDMLSHDIGIPLRNNNGVVTGVQAAPDFRMHLTPTVNKPRPVARDLVNMLFPLNVKSHIPIFSITGTTGKTITAFLLNYCLRNEGLSVGLTSTEGLYITDKKLIDGDMTYPENVALVLRDPTIDAAVLETSVEGIIRRGLGYKFADFGIVLNVDEDHIGNDDIEFIDDVAYAKSVVAEEVLTSGYSVLNADIPIILDIMDRLYSKAALFSRNKESNLVLQKHIISGGLAVTLENDVCKVYYKNQSFDLINVGEIPLFFGGQALFLSDEVLAVVTVLTAYGMHPDRIRHHLKTFTPSYANLPGRMNLFQKGTHSVLIDYAHNKKSFLGLKSFLLHFAVPIIGVFDAPGDRSDAELIQLGTLAAGMFSEVLLYDGKDMRGRSLGEIPALIAKGMIEAGFDKTLIHIEPLHVSAIRKVKNYTHSNNMIVIITAESDTCINLLKKDFVI